MNFLNSTTNSTRGHNNTNNNQNYNASHAGAVVSGSIPVVPQAPPVALCFGCLHSFPLQNNLLDKKAVAAAAARRRKNNNNNNQGDDEDEQNNNNNNETGIPENAFGFGDDFMNGSIAKAKIGSGYHKNTNNNMNEELGMLHEAPFGESLRRCLHSIRLHASRVEPLNDRSRESVAGMEDELKRLVVIIENELVERKKHADKLSVQLRYYSEWEGQIQRQLRLVLEQQQQQQKLLGQQAAHHGHSASARLSAAAASARFNPHATTTSHLLERFLASARAGTPEERPASRAQGFSTNITNRYGDTVSRIPRRPDGVDSQTASEIAASLPSMTAPSRNKTGVPVIGRKAASMDESTLQVFMSVSASVYGILEGLAVSTRSAIGALWLHTDDSGDELSAPFLVLGRNDGFARKGVSGEGALPFRIGSTASTVGAVAATGIAVSIRRPSGSGTEETLQQALTSTVRSTLIVPVFRKFHATERVCDGAIQLISWAHSSPFTQDDEHHAVAAANFISHIVSNFSHAFRGTWASRPPFDPTQLRKHATYNAALDQAVGDVRDSLSTAAAVGHAGGGQGTLIHRQNFGHAPVGSTKAIMRQELKAAGESATSQLVAPKDAVRDLQRYTQTLESSWKSAVLSLGDSEKRVSELQRQLDLAKQHGILEGTTTATSTSNSNFNNNNTNNRNRSVTSSMQQQQQNGVSPRRQSNSSPVPTTGRAPTAPSNVMNRRGSAIAASSLIAPNSGMGNNNNNLYALSSNKLEELEADTKNRMRNAAATKQASGKSTVFLTEHPSSP